MRGLAGKRPRLGCFGAVCRFWEFYSFWRDGKIHSLSPCRCGKKKALEAVGRPIGALAFVDDMGEPKLVLSRIGAECKTRKPSKSAQNSILLLAKRLLAVAEKESFVEREGMGKLEWVTPKGGDSWGNGRIVFVSGCGFFLGLVFWILCDF